MNGREWTPEEEGALRDALAACDAWPDVCERVPGRTLPALKARACKLGLRIRGARQSSGWTHRDEAAVAAALADLARRTGHTPSAVAAKATYLVRGRA